MRVLSALLGFLSMIVATVIGFILADFLVEKRDDGDLDRLQEQVKERIQALLNKAKAKAGR